MSKKKKKQFLQKQRKFKIDDIDVNKMLISKKESCGTNKSFKFFIDYSDDDDIKPLFMYKASSSDWLC